MYFLSSKYFRRGRKRKLKEDFGDFIGFGIKRRASLNQSGTTNSSLNQSATTVSSLNHSATTVSSLDQSVSDITHNQSHTGTVNTGMFRVMNIIA